MTTIAPAKKQLAPWKEFLMSKNRFLRPAKLERRWRNAKRITAIEGSKRDWLACWNHMFQLMGWPVAPIVEGDEVSVAGLVGPVQASTVHYCRVDGQRVLIAEVFWTAHERQQANGRIIPST